MVTLVVLVAGSALEQRGGEVDRGERGRKKREMREKRERKKKDICFSVFRVFKTQIYTLCDFTKRSFIFGYFKP